MPPQVYHCGWVQAGCRQAQANSYIFTRPAQHDMGRTCVVFLQRRRPTLEIIKVSFVFGRERDREISVAVTAHCVKVNCLTVSREVFKGRKSWA